ncbi:FHA domain-containing protein [Streptomyces monticola]|uniref:FHA domain-containing protein n=1 Tax=Streptomyces monticola TaxID=2666263 RepID=A0ABW2JVL0_9ACTN
MQIRLTVLGPLSGRTPQSAQGALPRACDVLVTAPAGTALSAVASGLATAVGIPEGPTVVYAGTDRLDAREATLGEPPLLDGAVLSLQGPAEPAPSAEGAAARLHVVAGPDAGGVHLLHGGRISIGRSADADVPLDDPDVSRLHCAVTVGPDGRVSVADLNSTNGTAVDGRPVTEQAVRLSPGALLRIGESTLRLSPAQDTSEALPAVADGEGHLRVGADEAASYLGAASPAGTGTGLPGSGPGAPAGSPATSHAGGAAPSTSSLGEFLAPPIGTTVSGYGDGGTPATAGDPTYGRGAPLAPSEAYEGPHGQDHAYDQGQETQDQGHPQGTAPQRAGTPARGTTVPRQVRRRGGLSAWARRLTGGRGEQPPPAAGPVAHAPAAEAPAPEAWPDPSTLLLTALGPGPRLWERDPAHPEALAVRLGTADRTAPDGAGLLPAVPVTVGLREAGALGLAGPRPRLAGLARAVLAQLAALHAPTDLEIVLLSTDRGRSTEERVEQWAWLGWLPHLRPGHGQDCRLLLAYDRDQAAARTGELLRRLEERQQDRLSAQPGTVTAQPGGSATQPGPLTAQANAAQSGTVTGPPDEARPPAQGTTLSAAQGTDARDTDFGNTDSRDTDFTNTDSRGTDARGTGFTGPFTVLVVDGDPGSAGLREATVRLAAEGPAAGIHVVCLAETPAASPASPVAATYEAACASSPAFRACGAVALLSGDVATALRLLRTSQGRPVGHGTVASVDAVSAAWAERFARALAPLRAADTAGERHTRVAAPLPQAARLLDELGLARATPASLMARWAAAADDPEALGGRAQAVLGAGPRGPVCADLVTSGPHLLAEGPPGSGRTELLRSAAAALASAERPDRLGLILVDGAGGERGDGLRVCTDLPHVTTHLAANDPVRMREFAQALSAELKRRAELLGRIGFAEWHTQRAVSGRIVAQRSRSGGGSTGAAPTSAAQDPGGLSGGSGDLDTPPSTTLKLRTKSASSGQTQEPGPDASLPRLVVLVDDIDALVAPALGAPGRPSAGSVVRALEAVVRDGERLGVHLMATTGRPERTADTEFAHQAALRIVLDAPSAAPEDPAPGRGRLHTADGPAVPFQAGRVTGRIPRTSTLRPTAVPLEWQRMGDPPARRPVRELGNGPTDLALLASALERAAASVPSGTGAPSA